MAGGGPAHGGARATCSTATPSRQTRSWPTPWRSRTDAGAIPAAPPPWPSGRWWRSSTATWHGPRPWPRGPSRIRREGSLDDYLTPPSSMWSWPARPCTGATAPRPASTLPRPPGCGRCSPTRSVPGRPDAARAGACLPGGGRRRRRPGGPARRPRHPPAAARPRRPPRAGRQLGSKLATIQGHRRRVLADHRRAPAPPPARHPSQLPRDRRTPVHLAAHGQDPGRLGLPEARRHLPQPGHPAAARSSACSRGSLARSSTG